MAALAATNQETTTEPTKISHHIIQNVSKQDFATSGTVELDEFDYLLVADSHGNGMNKDYYINLFGSIVWDRFLSGENWKEQLTGLCNSSFNLTKNAGTTFSYVKITSDHFEVTWIGDSSVKIYKKGAGEPRKDGRPGAKLVWRTKDHDYDNEEDIAKLIYDATFNYTTAWDIQASSPTTMLSKKAKTFKYSNGEATNMTRCLGHRGTFSTLGMVTTIIPRKKDAFYKIVAGSDGFWQVMTDEDQALMVDNSSEVLAQKARSRWEQEWTHDDSMGTLTKNVKIPAHNWDDVAVATWSN
jgi:serine/threonine protein phosphatase PrpC